LKIHGIAGKIIGNWSGRNRAIVPYLTLHVRRCSGPAGGPIAKLLDRRLREQPLVARLGEFAIEQQAEPFGDEVSGKNGLALNHQPVFARIAA
jgi:hypothetical protein